MAQNHIFLQANEVIHFTCKSRFSQYFGRLLKTRCRNEARTLNTGLCDAKQLRAGGRWLRLDSLRRSASKGFDLRVGLCKYILWHDAADSEIAISLVCDARTDSYAIIRLSKLKLIHHAARQQGGVAHTLDFHLAQHL